MTRGGLPHSDIPGSKLVCSSPGLFAACHVLHRLLAPRHSPYTLSSLTIKLKTDAHQSFAYQLVCDSFFRNTARVCGRKKLPCAEYSIVKDQRLPELCRQSVNVGSVGSPLYAALATFPTSVGARLKSLIRAPKLFSKTRFSKTPRRRDRSYQRKPSYSPCCPPSPSGFGETTFRIHPRAKSWWRIPGSNR